LLGCKVLAIFANYTSLRSHPEVRQLTTLPDEPSAPVFPLISDPTDRKHERRIYWFNNNQLYPTIVADEVAEKEAIEKKNTIIQVQSSFFPEEEVKEEDIRKHNIAAIAFFSDMTVEHFRMNPKRLHSISTAFWPATMSLSIDMTQPLPNFPIQRVVTKSKTLSLNQGQWAYEVDIWSHPLDAKKINLPEGVKSILLAISKQQALSFEIKVSLKQASKL